LNDLFPVELAIYEKVVAGEYVESRKLLPREERIRTMSLDEIARKKQELEELKILLTEANNPPALIKEVQKEIEEVDDYKILVESQGDLAPLVLQILNPNLLEQLKKMPIEVDEPDSFIDAYRPVRVISEKTVHDLNTPVGKEARISGVTEGPLSDATTQDVLSDLTATDLASDLSVGIRELKTAEDIEVALTEKTTHIKGKLIKGSVKIANNILQCPTCTTSKKMVQILSCGHSSNCRTCLLEKKEYDMKCAICEEYIYGTMDIFGNKLPKQGRVEVVDLKLRRCSASNLFFEANEPSIDALPTNVQDRSKKLGDDEYFYEERYACSFPTFIWRALNSHGCSELPAPSNFCMTNGGAGAIEVNLITKKNWRRYGVDVDSGRVAFVFTLRQLNNKRSIVQTLDIGVWEKKNDLDEWEIGPLFSTGKFNQACDIIKGSAERFPECITSTKTHPLFVLVKRVVQVMTGNQYTKLNCLIYI
jgi:hypothetical protein